MLHGYTIIYMSKAQQNTEGKSALVGLEKRSSDGLVLMMKMEMREICRQLETTEKNVVDNNWNEEKSDT